MRPFVMALLLGGTVNLSGCGSTPHDPYSNMRMLTPEELGVANRIEDPVEQAEKNQNAQFAKGPKTP
jgi:hypothetical protein